MKKHCDFCGDVLDASEEERAEQYDMEICDDCMHHGMTMLQKVMGKMKQKHAGRDPAADSDSETTDADRD